VSFRTEQSGLLRHHPQKSTLTTRFRSRGHRSRTRACRAHQRQGP
jgi:hypothetical protein